MATIKNKRRNFKTLQNPGDEKNPILNRVARLSLNCDINKVLTNNNFLQSTFLLITELQRVYMIFHPSVSSFFCNAFFLD